MDWVTTAIPKSLVKRIEKNHEHGLSHLNFSPSDRFHASPFSIIYMTLGYSSLASFIQEAVRTHLEKKEAEYDEIKGDRELGRKVRTGED